MTNIEWTHFPGYVGKSWNPVTGCTKIAQGGKNCYAEALAKRFWKDRAFTDVQTHADRLAEPLRARKPKCYFVNSMSDLFHDDAPFDFAAAAYGVMAACPQHKFIILTKRPKRMREFMDWCADKVVAGRVASEADWCVRHGERHGDLYLRGFHQVNNKHLGKPWPLPNVIHGYSAATQADLDAGIADLLATPSALRCLSLEPLIGPVQLNQALPCECCNGSGFWRGASDRKYVCELCGGGKSAAGHGIGKGLDWIIVGGESGPKARPCDIAWIRSIIAQCKAAAVPCFVKQLGAKPRWSDDGDGPTDGPLSGPIDLRDPKGAEPAEWPADLRVREFPEVPRG